jgi:hypothetical protein
MFPSLIARDLRARGHDAISVHESPGRGTSDQHVFDFARSEVRAVVTENVRDYRPLAGALLFTGEGHAGLEPSWSTHHCTGLVARVDIRTTTEL